jgi:hypothetical protein
MKISRKRKRQWIGFGVGVFVTAVTYTVLSLPDNEQMLSKGPMNVGHENMSCETCHTPAKGNAFQQIQANLMYSVGLRKTEADFGAENVDTKKCLECHDRANDRHPMHRFEEARFVEARKNLGVTNCESCHNEHFGLRVSQTNTGYCQNCHGETNLKNDPLEISHAELIAKEMWTTCLQCHDFHGNHVFKTAESMHDTIPLKLVREYFEGGKTPYADIKKYQSLTEEEWKKRK